MKNKYIILSLMFLAFAGCGDDDNDIPAWMQVDGVEAEIRVSINDRLLQMDNLSWDEKTAIGVNAGEEDFVNVKYQYWGDKSGRFEVVNGLGINNAIYLTGSTETTLTAYYPYVGNTRVNPNPIQVVTTAGQQEAQADINYLFASATGSENSPAVDFVFSHQMSKVVFLFEPEGANGNDEYALKDIVYTLSGLSMRGTFNTLTGVAAASETLTDLTIEVPLPEDNSEMSSTLILLPQNGTGVYMEIEMNGRHYNGGIDTMILESGYEYVYKVTIVEGSQYEPPVLTIELLEGRAWENDGTYPLTTSPI